MDSRMAIFLENYNRAQKIKYLVMTFLYTAYRGNVWLGPGSRILGGPGVQGCRGKKANLCRKWRMSVKISDISLTKITKRSSVFFFFLFFHLEPHGPLLALGPGAGALAPLCAIVA